MTKDIENPLNISHKNKRNDLQKIFFDSRKEKALVVAFPSTRTNRMTDYVNTYKQSALEGKWTIYFYEWSDIYRKPLLFKSLSSFIEFLSKCNIELNAFDRYRLDVNHTNYICCYPNTVKLSITHSYVALQTNIEYYKYNNK